MNKFLSTLVIITITCAVLLPATNLYAQASNSSSKAKSVETYTVTSVPAENGSYSISPQIPEDGKVPAGTVLTVKGLLG